MRPPGRITPKAPQYRDRLLVVGRQHFHNPADAEIESGNGSVACHLEANRY
jgi:hypothetical protein